MSFATFNALLAIVSFFIGVITDNVQWIKSEHFIITAFFLMLFAIYLKLNRNRK